MSSDEDLNLFMMCSEVNETAFADLPEGYAIRLCRPDEIDVWKAMPFDDPADAATHEDVMDAYLNDVYAPKGDLFYRRCLFVCDSHNHPIATGFLWRTLDAFPTLHWLKVRKGEEGKGIGRALLTHLLSSLPEAELPVYLHTQAGSFRAIKLYSDLGFRLITNPQIGSRKNHLLQARSYLRRHMPDRFYRELRETSAPESFLDLLRDETRSLF